MGFVAVCVTLSEEWEYSSGWVMERSFSQSPRLGGWSDTARLSQFNNCHSGECDGERTSERGLGNLSVSVCMCVCWNPGVWWCAQALAAQLIPRACPSIRGLKRGHSEDQAPQTPSAPLANLQASAWEDYFRSNWQMFGFPCGKTELVLEKKKQYRRTAMTGDQEAEIYSVA